MGYQFVHVDSWARSRGGGKKWTAAQIVAESERDPGACPHIQAPLPPVLLFGVMPRQALEEAEAWAAQAQDAQGRRLRKDGCYLLAGVISFPNDRQAEWPEFRDHSLKWLKKIYGDRLKSVVEHKDEPYPHLHFYAVPRPGERFGAIHAGKNAIDQVRTQGGSKKDQNEAYREAMRHWQDDFWSQVGNGAGLARIGPGRRRLTRGEWKAEQAAAKLMACEMSRLKRAGELVDLAQGNLEQAAQLAEVEAERHKKARKELEEIIMEVKKQDKQRAKEIHQTAQGRISAARMSIERQKAWEKRRDDFLTPPSGLSHSQAERRREFAKEYDFLIWPEDVRRRAVESSRQGGEALRRIVEGQREAREAENNRGRQIDYLRDQAADLKPWQLIEKARMSSELREAKAAQAAARAEKKRLALAEKKLIASCPVEVVTRYRYSKEEEREKAIAELLRREVSEIEAERREEAAEAKARNERMAMRPTTPKLKKPGGWEPPSPG